MSRVVKGSGPLDAKIVLVGEAPGAQEESQGKPFVGASGHLLTSMLGAVGIDRATCRLENIMQTRPQGNNFSEFYTDGNKRRSPDRDLVAGRARLIKDLEKIKPNIIIALGAEAMKALTGKPNIIQWRGSIIGTPFGKVIGTYHPAGILRQYENRPVAELDLRRALEESLSPGLELPQIICNINPSFDQAMSWLGMLRTQAKKLAFDIETSGKFIRCIGFALRPGEAFCIPLTSKSRRPDLKTTIIPLTDMVSSSCWTVEEELALINEMKLLLENEHIKKIAQNYPFDAQIIAENLGIDVRGLWMDTMLVHHACYCVTGKTEIHTLKGRKEIKDLVGQTPWVWAWKDGKPFPAKAKAIRLTRRKVKVVRVTYKKEETGEDLFIDMTPDHRVLLLSGKWVKAMDLQPWNRLTSAGFSLAGGRSQGYRRISFEGKSIYEHRYVLECLGSTLFDQTHHIDGDIENNEPENLLAIERSDHNDYHDRVTGHSYQRKIILENKEQVMRWREEGMSWQKIADKLDVGSHKNVTNAMNSINHKIISVQELEEAQDVYDLTVPSIGNFMTNDIVLHNCEFPKSLDFLTSIYTRHPRYSDYNPGIDTSLWEYNCKDAAITLEVAQVLAKESKSLGVWEFYKNHIQPTMIELTRMQNRGVKVDIKHRATLAATEMFKLAKALNDIKTLAGRDVNPGSPKQVGEYLYEVLKIPKSYHRKTGKVTTDKATLKTLANRHPEHRSKVEAIISYRESEKLIGTFLTSRLSRELDQAAGPRNVIRTSYNTAGTTSGRIASATTVHGEGGDLQQIPKSEIRRMFISRPGKVFIKTDLSQAEFRVVAWIAKIRRIIDQYSIDPLFDIHKWNASNIYSVGVEEVTSDMRSCAKVIVHGGNYRLGPRLAVVLAGSWGIHITFQEMKRAMEAYHEFMPEIAQWWLSVEETLRRTRTLVTVFGRRRMFFGRLDNKLYRSAYSFEPQSTVADVINRAIGLSERIMPRWIYPVLQVHDEIVWELAQDRVAEAGPLIHNVMSYELRFPGVDESLVIPIEAKIGTNWWDMTEYDLLKGTKT